MNNKIISNGEISLKDNFKKIKKKKKYIYFKNNSFRLSLNMKLKKKK